VVADGFLNRMKVLDGYALLIMSDQYGHAVYKAEMGDSAGLKVSKQRQHPTHFDPDQPESHS
jgi:hypothetical protein